MSARASRFGVVSIAAAALTLAVGQAIAGRVPYKRIPAAGAPDEVAGELARTGTNSLLVIAVALLLTMAGAGAVLWDRRRYSAS